MRFTRAARPLGVALSRLPMPTKSLAVAAASTEDVRGFGDLVRPGNIGHMEKPFNPGLKFHESAVVRQVAHRSGRAIPDLVLIGGRGPGILLRLLGAERDLFGFLIEAQDHHVEFHADRKDLARMVHALGPGKLADVNKPFDARLQFHESAVRKDVHDLAADLIADRVTLIDRIPRIRALLLEAERNFLFDLVDRDHDHVDLIAELREVGRMRDPSPSSCR